MYIRCVCCRPLAVLAHPRPNETVVCFKRQQRQAINDKKKEESFRFQEHWSHSVLLIAVASICLCFGPSRLVLVALSKREAKKKRLERRGYVSVCACVCVRTSL